MFNFALFIFFLSYVTAMIDKITQIFILDDTFTKTDLCQMKKSCHTYDTFAEEVLALQPTSLNMQLVAA
jgi:hypothetical protein